MTPKVLIVGTGRAGTSFLVNLLTACGCDTGFTHPNERWISRHKGGMETAVNLSNKKDWDNLPYIIKNPQLSTRLPELLFHNFVIEHVFIPVREIKDAAHSRKSYGIQWSTPEQHEESGGWEPFLLQILGKLTNDIIMNDIPHTWMQYPLLAKCPVYCYRRLGFLVKDVSFKEFESHFNNLSNFSTNS